MEGRLFWAGSHFWKVFIDSFCVPFPGDPVVKNLIAMQGTWRWRFLPWVRKIPWRRKWHPTPVFLSEQSPGQRSQEIYSPWGHKELDTTEAWCAMVPGLVKSQTRLSDWTELNWTEHTKLLLRYCGSIFSILLVLIIILNIKQKITILSTGPKSFAFLSHLQQILPSVSTTWPLGAIPWGPVAICLFSAK